MSEQHFNWTIKRNLEGRFIVKLPYTKNLMVSAKAKQTPWRSFRVLNERFQKNPDFLNNYSAFNKEVLPLGHSKEIPSSELDKHPLFYGHIIVSLRMTARPQSCALCLMPAPKQLLDFLWLIAPCWAQIYKMIYLATSLPLSDSKSQIPQRFRECSEK